MPKKILNIALNVPLDRLFDYLPPAGMACETCLVGSRVSVPFGPRQKIGVIVDHSDTSQIAEEKLRQATSLLDKSPLLAQQDLAFLRWVANYYHHPIGEVVFAALPLRLRKQAETLPIKSLYCRLLVPAAEALGLTRRAPRQQAIVQAIADAGGNCPVDILAQQFAAAKQAIKRLQAKNILQLEEKMPTPGVLCWQKATYALSAEQHQAIQAVQQQLHGFAAFLLDGVTGSGKTEVYLQLTKTVLQQGRNVLILVPEISLTPQLAERFRERLGDCVRVMHSGLAESAREINWQQARLGLARLILGTRSLILHPIAKLGLVVVDEEHDPSFKQQDGLRYSARDLAVIRAQRAKCPVLLGSATPSLESLYNVTRGRYQLIKLTQRAGVARPPGMRILDIRDQPLQAGLASPALAAVRHTLAKNQQALVFINRRGYAPVLSCYSCTWVSACKQCDAHQTVHRAAGVLVCHHCGAQRPIPVACPDCGSTELHPLGQGTEKIEDFLHSQFPNLPVLRIDRDTTARKNSLGRLLEKIHQADAALLVGTQMLAKGHHFPKVTLVCVLDADSGLFSTDFRATERMAQLLLQVAGRAGRADKPGQVIIQSRYPEHPLLQILLQQGYSAFAQAALAERLEAAYPPGSYQILLRAEAHKAEDSAAFLAAAAEWLQAHKSDGLGFWGPVAAPMARRVGRYRSHLLLQAWQREPLHGCMRRLRLFLQAHPLQHRVRWSIDVDPYDSY